MSQHVHVCVIIIAKTGVKAGGGKLFRARAAGVANENPKVTIYKNFIV